MIVFNTCSIIYHQAEVFQIIFCDFFLLPRLCSLRIGMWRLFVQFGFVLPGRVQKTKQAQHGQRKGKVDKSFQRDQLFNRY